jgi:hypothetical protein
VVVDPYSELEATGRGRVDRHTGTDVLAILLAHFRSAHEVLRGGLLGGETAEPDDPGVPILPRFVEAAELGEPILE